MEKKSMKYKELSPKDNSIRNKTKPKTPMMQQITSYGK